MGLSVFKVKYELVSGCDWDLYEWLHDKGYINEDGKLYLSSDGEEKKELIQRIKEEVKDKETQKYWIAIIENLEEDTDYEIA